MNKIIALAPMDGITNNAYRSICKHVWNNEKNIFKDNHDFYRFTEFMSCEGYIRNPRKLTRHLVMTQGEDKTIAQIYGGVHENLLQTAIDVDNKYAEFAGIELNIGCPSPKIMACEAGSGMLKCRPKTMAIIQKIAQSINKPFSIKTRAGLTEEDKKEQFDFIIEAANYCDMITVHGRTYKQGHSGQVDWEFLYKIKQELNKRNMGHIPIIGNGGLKSAYDGLPCLEILDGIMLGQAAMCSPRSLVSYTQDVQEIYDLTIKHLHLNIANEHYFNSEQAFDEANSTLIQPTTEQLEDITNKLRAGSGELVAEKRFSLIEFRKHLFWYVTGLPGNAEFKRVAATITEYDQLIHHIHTYFQPLLAGNHQ